jgi:hypothetical protein
LNNLFENVDALFKAFSDEMKAKGTWESVTVIQTSDLSRNCLLADMSAEAMRKLSVTDISYLSVNDY